MQKKLPTYGSFLIVKQILLPLQHSQGFFTRLRIERLFGGDLHFYNLLGRPLLLMVGFPSHIACFSFVFVRLLCSFQEILTVEQDVIYSCFSARVKSFMKFGVVFPYLIVLLQQFSAFPSLSCHSSFQVLLEQHK